MIVTNTEAIAGHKIVRILGLVQGNTVRAKHAGRDIAAGLKNLVGLRFAACHLFADCVGGGGESLVGISAAGANAASGRWCAVDCCGDTAPRGL